MSRPQITAATVISAALAKAATRCDVVLWAPAP